jgi:cobalamin biosynthesis Mg chelatase CobN
MAAVLAPAIALLLAGAAPASAQTCLSIPQSSCPPTTPPPSTAPTSSTTTPTTEAPTTTETTAAPATTARTATTQATATTAGSKATATTAAPTTTTTTPSLLVPGPAVTAPGPTTVNGQKVAAVSNEDKTGTVVALVITGLLVVALLLSLLTWRFWRNTRPGYAADAPFDDEPRRRTASVGSRG